MEVFTILSLGLMAFVLYRLKFMEEGYKKIHQSLEARGFIKKGNK